MLVEDFRTATWTRLVKELDERLLELRDQLESMTLTEQKTAEIRGRIDEVKKLTALPNSGAVEVVGPGGSWPQQDA